MNGGVWRIVATLAAVPLAGLAILGALPAASPLARGPDALAARADAAVRADPAVAAQLARAALAQAPLNPLALRTLATAALRADDLMAGAELMVHASLLSWRDPVVQAWLFDQAQVMADPAAALNSADALARTASGKEEGFAGLTSLLGDPAARVLVPARLATRPFWRLQYLKSLAPRDVVQARAVAGLLAALDRTAAPVSEEEAAAVTGAMVRGGFAREAWAYARARADGRAPVSEDFRRSLAALVRDAPRGPFHWAFAPGSAAVAIDERDEAGRPALVIRHGGDRAEMFLARRLVLAPGRYRVRYVVAAAPADAEKLRLDVRCGDRQALPITAPAASRRDGDEVREATVMVAPGCAMVTLGFSLDARDDGNSAELALRSVDLRKAT